MKKSKKFLSADKCYERLHNAQAIAWNIFDDINEIYMYGNDEFFRKEGRKEKVHKTIETIQTLQNLLYELED